MRKIDVQYWPDGNIVDMPAREWRKIRAVLRAAEGARIQFPTRRADRLLGDAIDALNRETKK